MSIKLSDVLFFAGGECLQKFGVPVMRFDRRQGRYTFTRSGAVGPFIDKAGTRRTASANRLRLEYFDLDGDGRRETPAILLEPGGANVQDEDDLTNWTNPALVTAGVDDPFGGTGAYTVEDDNPSSGESKLRAVTFTGDGVKSASFAIRENTFPGSSVQQLIVNDATAATERLLLSVNSFASGVPQVTEGVGSLLGMRYLGNGYWLVLGQTTSVTAANSHQVRINPTSFGSDTGSIDVYRVNAFNAAVPLASVLDESQTLGAETWSIPFPHPPRVFASSGVTFYVKFIELGTIRSANFTRLWQLSQSAGAQIQVDNGSSNRYRVALQNDVDSEVNSTAGSAPSYGDTVELRIPVFPTGAVQIAQSLNGLAETVASASSAPASGLPTAWGSQELYVNSHDSGARGVCAFPVLMAVRGLPSMAELRQVFTYDLLRAVA